MTEIDVAHESRPLTHSGMLMTASLWYTKESPVQFRANIWMQALYLCCFDNGMAML